MIGGRTLSSDPAYLAHMAGEDLSDSDDDQSVGGRSFVSRGFGGGGEGEGEEGGPVSFGWGAGGGEDGGALVFDTCSKFFTVVCEVENVCRGDIVVWGEGEGEGGEEVVTAGGMSRILVNLDRIVGMEDFVTLQGHLEKVQVLKWKEVEDGGDGGDGGRVGVLRVGDEAIHDLFDDDEDVLRRISGLGFEVDVQAEGFFKEREWGSAKATIRIDKAALASLKNQKIGSVICEWLCDGEGEGEGDEGEGGGVCCWNGRKLRKFELGEGGSKGGKGDGGLVIEHEVGLGFGLGGGGVGVGGWKFSVRVALTFGNQACFFSDKVVIRVERGREEGGMGLVEERL